MAHKAYQISFDQVPADSSFYADVLELEVTENAAAPSTFRLRVTLTKQDSGEWDYTADDRFSPFTRVAVAVGFSGTGGLTATLSGGSSTGGLDQVIDGYITGVSVHMGAQPEDAYLEVEGVDSCVLLSFEEKTVAWPNLADSDIVQQIISSYGFSVSTESTSPVHQEDDTLIVQRGTDLQFIRSLARRNGYEFYFSGDPAGGAVTAYFGPPQLGGTPQSDLAVQFGDRSNLVSFDIALNGLRPLDVMAQQVDASSKQASPVDASTTQLASLGSNLLEDIVSGKLDQLVTPAQVQGRMLLLAQPTADPTELSVVTQAVRDEAGWLTTASGEINSDAYGFVLHARRPVLVKGPGSEHSGSYYVTSVTHRLSSDGSYTQTFEARRNAKDLDGSEQFGGGPGGGLGLPSR